MSLTPLDALKVISTISTIVPTIESDIGDIDAYRLAVDLMDRLSVTTIADLTAAVELDPSGVRRHVMASLSALRAPSDPTIIDVDHNGVDDRIDMVNVKGQIRVRLVIIVAVSILLMATLIAAIVVPDTAGVSAVLTTVATSLTSVLIMVVGGIQPIIRPNRPPNDGAPPPA